MVTPDSLRTAAIEFVESLKLCAETEQKLRDFMPAVSRETLMEIAFTLAEDEDLEFAAEVLEAYKDTQKRTRTPSQRTPQKASESGLNQSQQLLLLVRNNPGLDRQELADIVGVDAQKISSVMANLKRWGWTTSDDTHRWWPTDKEGLPVLSTERVFTRRDPRIRQFLTELPTDHFKTKEMATALERTGSSLSSSLASLALKGVLTKAKGNAWHIDREALEALEEEVS